MKWNTGKERWVIINTYFLFFPLFSDVSVLMIMGLSLMFIHRWRTAVNKQDKAMSLLKVNNQKENEVLLNRKLWNDKKWRSWVSWSIVIDMTRLIVEDSQLFYFMISQCAVFINPSFFCHISDNRIELCLSFPFEGNIPWYLEQLAGLSNCWTFYLPRLCQDLDVLWARHEIFILPCFIK